MTIEAAKQALEALEKCMYPQLKQLNAITALRTAIAEAEKQKPVAYVTGTYAGRFVVKPLNPAMVFPVNMALYTTPPAAQPAPLQVSPTDFVDMVLDKEDAIGKPIFWAEWPNREKNT
jgi:hypothetical protein